MFKLPKKVKDDLLSYQHSLKDFEAGKISSARFKGIRVPWGIYSHRGGKIFMNRIRIPAGVVTPAQLRVLGAASKEYGDGNLHITTRQDIQIHNVEIRDTVKLMEFLHQYDLSPRGGGGNTARNIIACPFSGICRDEVFDVRGYAMSVTEYLLSQETSFTLPRKFKITFSGCGIDCGGCLINDIGFLARVREGKKGFKVYVGGGMGASSRIGKLLEEFIHEKDLGYCVQTVKNIFYRKGNRKNKHHNRLRFLIEDMGFGEFKKLYEREFNELKDKEHIALRRVDFPERKDGFVDIPKKDNAEYNEFLKYNVRSQRQKGYSSVELRIPRGDISQEKMILLADLEKDFNGVGFRISQNQNLVITWVENKGLYELFKKLKNILPDFLYASTLVDIVACKGAVTCNLGLCNSPGLSREIEEVIKQDFIGKSVFHKLDIKLNGCPNACGHQPIGKISFCGMVKRVDKRPVPFYRVFLGGRKELDNTKFSVEQGVLPARNIPLFLREFLQRAEEKIGGKEEVCKFLENEAETEVKKILDKYDYVPPYSEDKNFYIDWGRDSEFSMDGLGTGECGAGVLDMIIDDLSAAKITLEEAKREGYPAEKIKKVLYLSSRALLIVKGIDPKTEEESFLKFKEKLVDAGIASGLYCNVKEVWGETTDALAAEDKKRKFLYAKEFLGHINQLHDSMDSSLNFPKQGTEPGPGQIEETAPVRIIDLKGTPCPLNYVKAKLVMETLNSGDKLGILLDNGEPINNVPKSLEGDGHEIMSMDKVDDYWKILVKKV